MRIYLKYLSYVLRHKWHVFLACCQHGIIWRGLVHDLSKFLPSEFVPYARHFYGRIETGRDGTGYYKPTDTGDKAFDYAWFLHQKCNDHHWQWWVMPEDTSGVVVLKMSDKAVREMVCDWIGAGKAQGKPDTCKWYSVNRKKLQLHPETRRHVEWLLYFGYEDGYYLRGER